jgi:NitT/TauT family transport system substrate-binding protein
MFPTVRAASIDPLRPLDHAMNRNIASYFVPLAVTAMLALAAAQPAAAADKWRHGVVVAKGDSGFLFMAARNGFDKKYGLEIEMKQFASGLTPLKALLAGELDSIEVSPVVALPAMNKGADVKVIGCAWPGMTYSLFAGGTIATVADLKGKVIGVSGPGSLPDLFAREALKAAGLGDRDVDYAVVGSSSSRVKSVLAGVLAAAASSSEFEPTVIEQGGKVLLRGVDSTPDFLHVCIMSSSAIIAAKRDMMARFLAASMEAYAYALAHRDEVISLSRDVAHLKPDDPAPAFVFDEAVKYRTITPDFVIPKAKLQWTQDMLVTHGVLPKSPDVSAFIDDSVRAQAAKEIRP